MKDMYWTRVAKTDTCWNWQGTVNYLGYGFYSGKSAHRLMYEHAVGPIPDGLVIDHRCHNRGCVNPDHLQAVTQKQNTENRKGAQANNRSSGVRGVTFLNGRWVGYVNSGGKHYHVGRFDSIAEAEQAVIAKRNELYTNNLVDRLAS